MSNELLKNMKYLVDNSACSLKLKQKIFLDMKEIDRQLKEYKLIKNKLVIIFQSIAVLEGIVFREE